MPEIKKHAPGSPSWVELATSDEKGALAFYKALLGWKDRPAPMGPGQLYHMQQKKGLDAAAIYQLRPEQKGVPPHWTVYFTVGNVDATSSKVAGLGGRIIQPPFDVMESGRMSMVQDPQGAMFALWQAKNHIGCQIMGEPGTVNWFELMTTDARSAARFYSSLLGIEAKKFPGPGDYTVLNVEDKGVAGVFEITPDMPKMPPAWMVYFGVSVVGRAAQKVIDLGGKVLMEPKTVAQVGRFATVQDPQGAAFYIFKPDPGM